jgi:hypothetical protein
MKDILCLHEVLLEPMDIVDDNAAIPQLSLKLRDDIHTVRGDILQRRFPDRAG